MCNLYSVTTNQAAIRNLFKVTKDSAGNLPPMPGVFPDYPAPVVRNAGADRELTMMRWGMPPPPRAGGFPVTNIRNTSSPHRRTWLKPETDASCRSTVSRNMHPSRTQRPKKRMSSGSRSMTTGRCLCSLVSGPSSRATEGPSQSRYLALTMSMAS